MNPMKCASNQPVLRCTRDFSHREWVLNAGKTLYSCLMMKKSNIKAWMKEIKEKRLVIQQSCIIVEVFSNQATNCSLKHREIL